MKTNENVGFHSVQKTVFDKLAVGKKVKKKACLPSSQAGNGGFRRQTGKSVINR